MPGRRTGTKQRAGADPVSITRRRAAGSAVALLSVCFAEPALAHHFMGGHLPRTALQGLLSGLGHPVIGLDHLAFIIGVGLLANLADRIFLLPAVFICGTLAGAFLHLGGIGIPSYEIAVSATVLAIAAAVFFQRHAPMPVLAALLGAAGIVHGYAYAESIFGAEPAPLYAYLTGFALVQYAIAAGSAILFAVIAHRYGRARTTVFRLAGLAIAVIGVTAVTGIL